MLFISSPAPLDDSVSSGFLPTNLIAPEFKYHTAASVPVTDDRLLPDGTTNHLSAIGF